jgi:hypothetical protein
MKTSPEPATAPVAANTEPVPEWLQKLQNERWEAEILISGGAFIGLLSGFSGYDVLRSLLFYTTKLDWQLATLLIAIVRFGWWLLLIGFLVHLVLRGYWVGLVGLNSVFPAGINRQKLGFKGRFTSIAKVSSNVPMILQLDKICGTLFALTFVALFSMAGFLTFFGFLAVLFDAANSFGAKSMGLEVVVIIMVVTIGLVTLVDYLTFGLIKRDASFAAGYYPVHSFVSVLTFSFLYRRLYYTLASNIQRRFLALIVGLQCVVIALMILIRANGSDINANLLETALLGTPDQEFLTLSEEVVTGNTLVVTIIHNARFEDAMFSEWQAETNTRDKKSFEDLPAEEQLKVFQKTYEVHIDSTHLQTPDWTFKSERLFDSFFSPSVVKMRSRINVVSLSEGIHELRIRLALEDEDVLSVTGQKKRGNVGKQDFYVDR